MKRLSIGVIKEGKKPSDSRTPLTPHQISFLQQQHPDLQFTVQSSPVRCFSDQEYIQEGIEVKDDISHCDILFGVKEVPIDQLIPEKTYFFFSHTIKKQPANQKLLQNILQKNITMVDYETLTNDHGIRIIAFGRWAGIVGTYNAFYTFGKKYNLYETRRAFQCKDYSDLQTELTKITLPNIKIIITGNGRVAHGGLEILNSLPIKKVEPIPFIFQTFDEPVFTQIDVDAYNHRKDGSKFSFEHFFAHPEAYASHFQPYAQKADILISSSFWDPRAPKLFDLNDLRDASFNIKTIADITCDINGSIPTTIRPTTIEEPVYDFDPESLTEKPAFSSDTHLTEMAIDNLPNELPRDASDDFGRQLIENVLPALLGKQSNSIIERATIATKGHLNEKFNYLQDYVNQD